MIEPVGTKTWSVYYERAELPPLRVKHGKNEAAARKEFEDNRCIAYLAVEEVIAIRDCPRCINCKKVLEDHYTTKNDPTPRCGVYASDNKVFVPDWE
jgi:hypothetical protein